MDPNTTSWGWWRQVNTPIFLLLGSALGAAQKHPGVLEKPAPAPAANRIEVRFELGEKSLTCDRFYLSVKDHDLILVKGKSSSGFQILEKAGAPSIPQSYRGMGGIPRTPTSIFLVSAL
jgi:hypothetical protein